MNDEFLTVLRILTNKLTDQADEIKDLRYQIENTSDLRDDLESSKVRERDLAEDRNYWVERYNSSQRELTQAREALYQAQDELRAFRFKDPAITGKAVEWLAAHYKEHTYEGGGYNKISMIKTVREITGFGLKDSKDFVEDWLAKNAA